LGLLLGLGPACDSQEAPREEAAGREAAAGRAEPSKPAAPTPAVGAWVRVSQQRLFRAPSLDAKLIPESEVPFRIAEVVGLAGEFVELRTVVAFPTDLCGTSSGGSAHFELHFFAELEALETVLTQIKLVELEDGSRFTFMPGVPIDLTGAQPRLKVGEASFIVPLIPAEIGRWFPAASIWTPPRSPSSWSRARPLHYGEQSFEAKEPPFVDVRTRRSHGDDVLLTFDDACGEYTLRVVGEPPPPEVDPERAHSLELEAMFQSLPSEPKCSPGWDAPVGVAVTWQGSGEVAGVTRAPVSLPNDAREGEGKVCFTASEFGVCIASEQLTRRECAEGELVSQVVPLEAKVDPGSAADLVRDTVRENLDELLGCYDAGLREQPQLAGTVTIAFEIAANGEVSRSSVQEARLIPDNEKLAKCMAKAVKRWYFGKLEGGGSVSVSYSFALGQSR
jgi:hypothetical protein